MHHTSIGIALSGGGIKGAAHVGALQFFREIGIQPKVYSGSSAGAIIGALAAADYSTEDMLYFLKSMNIFKVSNFAWGKPGFINTDKFEASLRQFFPDDSFEALKYPLYVSVTDITNGFSKVVHSGPLIKILMASSAYPVVFSPIEIDGVLYSDGAILNNFPVEPLLGKCQKIIGINVHRRKEINNAEISSSYKLFRRAYDIGIHYSNFKKYKYCDVVIAPDDLKKFSTLRTQHTDEIFQIGYQTALEQKDELLKLIQV
ncbi:MAG: patatin-like phospholipase family protein [Chitinophagales bacterium]